MKIVVRLALLTTLSLSADTAIAEEGLAVLSGNQTAPGSAPESIKFLQDSTVVSIETGKPVVVKVTPPPKEVGPAIKCAAGGYLSGNRCYDCPTGYKPTLLFHLAKDVVATTKELPAGVLFSIDSRLGCYKPSNVALNPLDIKRLVHAGIYVKDALCRSPGFFDVSTGACWMCPTSFKRTVFGIKGDRACVKHKPTVHAKATRFTTKPFCEKGSFFDINRGFCFTCPPKMNRVAKHDVRDKEACSSGPLHFRAGNLQ